MDLVAIKDNLPKALLNRLAPGEEVYFFMYSNFAWKARITQNEKSWFALTDHRLIYDLTGDSDESQRGDIPIKDVDYVSTKVEHSTHGCRGITYHRLYVGKSNWAVNMPVKDHAIAAEILSIVDAIKRL